MARFLRDTDAVIDYLKGFPSSVRIIEDLHARDEDLCLCAVVVAEVHAGVAPADRPNVDVFLDACTYLPTSADDAKQAGSWRYDYARQGHQLSVTDTLIAATAARHQATVVTGNIAHFPTVATLPLPKDRDLA